MIFTQLVQVSNLGLIFCNFPQLFQINAITVPSTWPPISYSLFSLTFDTISAIAILSNKLRISILYKYFSFEKPSSVYTPISLHANMTCKTESFILKGAWAIGTKYMELTRISEWLQPLSEWKLKFNLLYLIPVLCQWPQGMEHDDHIRVEVWFSSYDGVYQNTLFVKMNLWY